MKIRKIALPVIISLFSLLIAACANYGFFWGRFDEQDVDERSSSVKNFNSKAPDMASQTPPSSSSYSVIVVTDLHYGSSSEKLDENGFLEWLDGWYKKYSGQGENPEDKNEAKLPRFMINLGDTADGGHDSEYLEYLEFEKKIKALAGKYLYGESDSTADSDRKFKVYGILGNHDLYNNGSEGFFKYIYPNYSSYYFTIDADGDGKAFSYYFLDTANGTTGTSQLDDFKDKISADSSPKIVFTHYPVYAGGTNMFMIIQNTLERNILLTYFAENNVKQVYEGHAHANYGFDFKKFREDVIGSLRFSGRDDKSCAVFTVNEETQQVETETIRFK